MPRPLVALAVAALVALPLVDPPDVRAGQYKPRCEADDHVVRSLAGGDEGRAPALGSRLLRFVNLSDSHILDDEASPVITGNYSDPVLAFGGNESAQRLQEEYTDEVLNAMESTITECHGKDALEFMLATGDLTDNMTLNETRRYIDNLDGVADQPTAYERYCGYLTYDPNLKPKGGGEDAFACPLSPKQLEKPTGRAVADAQAPEPDDDDPTYVIQATRTPRQIAETGLAAAEGDSLDTAPGLPPSLRCTTNGMRQTGPKHERCPNHTLPIPHYAVFGNHDGAVRGTVTFQKPFQAGAAAVGRYFLESQREFINEMFETQPHPGPVGHGFAHAGDRLEDGDDRNDGWYAFTTDGGVRMIVLNTIWDGVREEFHRGGETNTDTHGFVRGSEVTDPRGVEKGYVSPAQLEWLRTELGAARGPVLVFSHHPTRSFFDTANGAAVDDTLAAHPNVVAHIAGHTHEHKIDRFTPVPPPSGDPRYRFWQIETASLVDYPQEGRIVELFTLAGRPGFALKLTVIEPDQRDPVAAASRRLAIAEATCSAGALVRKGTFPTASEGGVRQFYCRGKDSLDLASGGPLARDVLLVP